MCFVPAFIMVVSRSRSLLLMYVCLVCHYRMIIVIVSSSDVFCLVCIHVGSDEISVRQLLYVCVYFVPNITCCNAPLCSTMYSTVICPDVICKLCIMMLLLSEAYFLCAFVPLCSLMTQIRVCASAVFQNVCLSCHASL
jgi:hypothetical protein